MKIENNQHSTIYCDLLCLLWLIFFLKPHQTQ